MIEQMILEILSKGSIELFAGKRSGQDTYTARLWDDRGKFVVEVTRFNLVEAVKVAAEYMGRERE